MRAPLFLRTTVVGQLSSYLLLPLLLLLCTTKAHLVEGTIIKGWYQERDDHRAAAAGFLLGNGSALTVSGGTSGTSGGEGGHLRPLPAEQQADLEENKGRLILLQKQARDRKVREILRFLADPDTVAKIAELKFLEYVSTELLVGRENEDNDSSTRKDTKKPQPADVRSIAAFFQQFLEGVTAVEGTLAGFRPFGVLDEIKGERGDCSYPTTTQELSLELQYEKMREHYARVIETYLTESKVLNNESDRDGNNLIGKGNGGGSSAAERSPPSPQEAESRLDFAKRFRKVAQRAVVSKEKVKDIEKAANDYWKARKNYLGLLKEKEKDQQQRKEEEEGSTSKKEDGLPSITITSDSEMKQEEDLPSVTSEKMKHDEEDLPSVTGEKMKHDEEDPTRVTSEMKQEEDLPSVTSEKMKQDGEDPSPDTSEKKEEQDNNDGQRVFHLPWGVRVKDEDAEGGAAHSASSGDVQAMLEETEDLAKQVKRLQGEQKEQDQQDSAELLDPGVKNAEAEVKEAADRLRSVLGSSFGLNEILIGPKDHDVRHGNQFDMLLASFIREEAEEKQHRSEVEDVLGVGGNPKHFVRLGTEEKITGIPLGTKLSTSRHPAYSFYKKGDEINETTGGADAARSSKSTASCSSASSKRSLSALFVHACRAALKHDPDGNPSPACRDVLKHDPDGNPSPACRAALMSEDAGQEVVPRIARFQGSLEIGSKIRRTTSSTGEDTSLPTVAPSSRTPQDEHADDVDDLQELAPPLQEQKMADENECTGEQNENEYPGDSGSWRLISSLRDGPAIPPPPLYIVADTVKKDPVYFAFLAVAHKALKEAKLLRGPFTSNAYTPRNRATPANKTWTAAATSMAELLLSAFRGSSSWSTTTSSTTTSIMPAESHTRMTTTGASTTTSMTESDAIRSSFVVAVVIRKLLNMQVLSTVLDVAPIFLSKILEEAEKRLVAGAGGSRQGDDGTQTRRDGLQTHNLFLKSSTFTRATTMSHFLYELPEGVRKEAVKREIGEHGAVVDRSPEGYLKREDEDFTTNFWRISAIQEEMRDILRRSTRRLGLQGQEEHPHRPAEDFGGPLEHIDMKRAAIDIDIDRPYLLGRHFAIASLNWKEAGLFDAMTTSGREDGGEPSNKKREEQKHKQLQLLQNMLVEGHTEACKRIAQDVSDLVEYSHHLQLFDVHNDERKTLSNPASTRIKEGAPGKKATSSTKKTRLPRLLAKEIDTLKDKLNNVHEVACGKMREELRLAKRTLFRIAEHDNDEQGSGAVASVEWGASDPDYFLRRVLPILQQVLLFSGDVLFTRRRKLLSSPDSAKESSSKETDAPSSQKDRELLDNIQSETQITKEKASLLEGAGGMLTELHEKLVEIKKKHFLQTSSESESDSESVEGGGVGEEVPDVVDGQAEEETKEGEEMKKNWADLIWGHDEEDGKENLISSDEKEELRVLYRYCNPKLSAFVAARMIKKEEESRIALQTLHIAALEKEKEKRIENGMHLLSCSGVNDEERQRIADETEEETKRIQEEIEENVQKLEQIKHRKEQDDHDSAITAEAVEVDGVASPKEFWKKHMKDKGSGRARFEYHCAHALAWYQIRSSHSDIVTRFATGRSIFSSEGGHNLDPVINVLGTHLLEGPKCLGMSVLFKGIMDAMFQRKVLRVRTEVNSDQNHVWTHVYFNIFFCDFSEVQDHLQREQSEHPQVAPAPQGELPGCSAIKWGSSFGCVLVQAWRSVGFDTGRLWSPSFFGSRQEFLAHSSGVVVQQGQPSALLQGSSSERTTSHGGRGVEPPRSSGSETHQKEEEKERQSHQKDKGEERQSHRQSEMMEKERQSHQKEKGEERQFIVDIAQLLLGNLENKVELSQCSSPLEHSTLTPHRAEVAEWYTKALSENCALSVVTDEPGKCCAEEFHQGEGGASGQEAARYIQDAENKCVRNCSIITSKEGEAGGPAPVDESSSCCDNYVTLRVEDNDYQGIPFVTHPEESLSVEWISKMISIGVLS